MSADRSSVFTMKTLCIAIGAVLLSACQTSADLHGVASTNSAVLNPVSASASAKAQLLEAYRAHLASERYALTTYRYQAAPVDGSAGIDADADSLWQTALKLSEYRTNENLTHATPDAYRSTADYLAEGDSLPYLRYDDEVAGRVPSDAVSRAVALGDEYGEVNDDIKALNEEQANCAYIYYQSLKEAIKSDANININSNAYKDIKKDRTDCLNDIGFSYEDLTKKAQGYQVTALNEMKACEAIYENDLQDIFRVKHNNKPSAESQLLNHEIAYRQSVYCRAGKGSGTFDNEPLVYLAKGTNENILKVDKNLTECVSQMQTSYDELRLVNKNYQNNANEFAENYYNAVHCAANGFKNIFTDADISVLKPTSSEEAHAINKQLYIAYIVQKDGKFDARPVSSQWFDSYKQMKSAELSGTKINPIGKDADNTDAPLPLPDSMGGAYANMLSMMLEHMKKTPEQINAKNLYQYQNTVMTALSHHEPAKKRINSVLGLDYHSATASQSMQLPVSMDFNGGVLIADVSAGLPLLALASPQHALLPSDIPDGSMRFMLPADIKDAIPAALIYDSVNRASVQMLSELNSELFTPVDSRQDSFARQIGASQVIKLNFGLREAGKGLAVMAKLLGADMKAYIDAHPERYTSVKAAKIKKAIDDWTLVAKGFRTDDAGSVYQLIEAIAPMNFTGSWYAYLDGRGKLIGTQQIGSTDSYLENVRVQAISQTTFNQAAAAKHPLFKKLSSQDVASAAIDGNAWLKNIKDELTLKKIASSARAGYKTAGEIDWENCTEFDVDASGELICTAYANAAAKAAQSAKEAVEIANTDDTQTESYQAKRAECGVDPVVIDDDGKFACLSDIHQALAQMPSE